MGDYNNQDNKTDNQPQQNNQNFSQTPQYQQPQYQSPQYQQPQQQYQQPQQQYQQPQYQQPQFQQAPYQQPNQPDYQYQQFPNAAQKPNTGMAIASLVLGIVSVVSSCLWFLSIPAGIVGVILGIISLRGKKDGKGMAIAGLILSGVGIVVALIIIISAVVFVNDVGNNWDSWYNDLNNLY